MSETNNFYFPCPVEQHYCSQCGGKLSRLIPPGDNRGRDCCTQCGAVHYRNPLIVTGTVTVHDGKVLLCRRAIEPRYNTWTLPAGFMELKETTAQGAIRETVEEAGVQPQLGQLYTVMDAVRASQVHIYYLATADSDAVYPGEESLEAAYFALDEIPWDELSFTTVIETLKRYVADTEKQSYPTHFFST